MEINSSRMVHVVGAAQAVFASFRRGKVGKFVVRAGEGGQSEVMVYEEYEKNNVSVPCVVFLRDAAVTHLYVSRSSIEVEMQVLDLAIVCKFILELFLGRFLVDVCDEHDPPFDRCPFRGRDRPRQ